MKIMSETIQNTKVLEPGLFSQVRNQLDKKSWLHSYLTPSSFKCTQQFVNVHRWWPQGKFTFPTHQLVSVWRGKQERGIWKLKNISVWLFRYSQFETNQMYKTNGFEMNCCIKTTFFLTMPCLTNNFSVDFWTSGKTWQDCWQRNVNYCFMLKVA